MIRKLQKFLETTLDVKASDQDIETTIQQANRKNRQMRRFFEFAAMHPPVINWQEMYDVGFLALPATAEYMEPILEKVSQGLKKGWPRASLRDSRFSQGTGNRLPGGRRCPEDLQDN